MGSEGYRGMPGLQVSSHNHYEYIEEYLQTMLYYTLLHIYPSVKGVKSLKVSHLFSQIRE